MAITLDATVGGANANTYADLSTANSFIEGLVLSDDTAAWDNSSNDNKNRALFTAAQRIDREKFLGARVADTQALEWPRSGVRKPDTYTNLYGLSFPNRLVADYYTDTEIPNADEITTGPNEALSLPPESRLEYVSPSGDSYDSQFKRLGDIKDQINTLSLAAVLGQKLVGETAEAKRIDRSQNDSTMMVIAQQMQDLIDNCLKFHSEYLNEPNAGSSFVNRDFVTARLEPAEIDSLLKIYAANGISQEKLLEQLASGEILGDDFDIEEELEKTQSGGLIEMNQESEAA